MKLSSKDVKNWLEREAGSSFVPVHAKAKKLLDEMRKALENFAETSKTLVDNSEKEIEKRNMKTYKRARALNKLARLFLERARQVKIPDQVTYHSLSAFEQEAQKAMIVTEVDVRNWFPRISPFFIIDRRRFLVTFERTKLSLRELHDFMTKEYVKTKTLEETFGLADKLLLLGEQVEGAAQRKEKVEGEKALIEKEIGEARQKMADLRSTGNLSQLGQTDLRIEALSGEVKQSLHHLQKPFIKLRSLSLHGGGSGLTQEEVSKLGQYIESPFEAFSTEEVGYPLLKEILRKLGRSMSDKLNLKPEKERKAKQTIDAVLTGSSLADLHGRCREALALRRQLSASPEVMETQQGLSKLQEHLENLGRRKGIVESEEATLERTRSETVERIKHHKNEIEKNVFSFLNRKVLVA